MNPAPTPSASPALPITAVIVHYHAPGSAAGCARSLLAGTRPPERILVLDNGSAPGALAAALEGIPRVEVRTLPRNLGFAGALDASLADAAPGGALLVLNQDCTLEADCVARLAACLEDARTGAACPTVVFPDGAVWAQGGEAARWTGRTRNIGMGGPPARLERPARVDYAPGCAALVRADLWRRIGGMEPRYFMYAEDADLGARLARLGFTTLCDTRATCVHEGSAASGSEYGAFQSYFRLRNRALYVARNGGLLGAALFFGALLPLLLLRDLVRYARMGRLAAYAQVWRGLAATFGEARPPRPAGAPPREVNVSDR